MILEYCSTVSQGVVISRVQQPFGSGNTEYSLYSMKEMNESLGREYHGNTEKLQKIHVSSEKAAALPVTKEGMVLVNLTAHRAVAIQPEHIGKLIPSNFAIIEPKENLHTLYFEWYFNEHPSCRKQLRIATQGSIISALSIQMLRSLDIDLPKKNKQRAIGMINHLIRQKKGLLNEKIDLEATLTKHKLLSLPKGEIK
ncbi:hypothetical protein [Priestia megaterium]|uniref:hypothetical protein n=1 Tax=Priestia megaterium TaxID=1404 RepID=UPI003D288809